MPELPRLYKTMADVEMKLEVGKLLQERFISHALDYPPENPSFTQVQATQWLEAVGFERVEWIANQGDILLCLLWWRNREKDRYEEFILEFAGDSIITVFEPTASVEE